jgi:DNA polymerase-3 subunit epsilon
MYAVVDIETTGGNSYYDRIIEVAVFITNGQTILKSYQQLVQPGRSLSSFITSLTGINDDMLEDAPTFEEIADGLREFLADHVFVAHNVNFDLGFVKNELRRVNIDYQPKKLCTVRLSRKILKNLSSYSLGNLCQEMGIPNESRHRAFGDAEATTVLLNTLIARDTTDVIGQFLKANSKEATLPPNLDKSTLQGLPFKPGVYYFLNKKGEVLYVGKAKNLRKRIDGHFTENSKTRSHRTLWENIFHITYEECGNELIALILELYEIKRLWPPYNRALKTRRHAFGLYCYEDQQGYLRLMVQSSKGRSIKPCKSYASASEAQLELTSMIAENQLCPSLCGMYKTDDGCYDYQAGNCKGACLRQEDIEAYNDRVLASLNKLEVKNSLLILGKGRNQHENSIVWLENGQLQGFGFVDESIAVKNHDELTTYIKPIKPYPEYHAILQSFISKQPKEYRFIPM